MNATTQPERVYVVNSRPISVNSGALSSSNSSAVALAGSATYTGTAEDVTGYPSICCAVKTDLAGTLYMEFSPDATNWDSSLSFSVAAATNEVHRLSVTRRYFRARFTNGSGSGQSYFRLQTTLGTQPPLTSPLNGIIQSDADALIVRPTDFQLDATSGLVTGYTTLNKFGRNPSVGTTIVPITTAGVYQTPTALTSLEIVSSDTNDTVAGTGARTIFVQGIGTGWAEISETINTNGTSAVSLANQYYRIYRWYVVTSGTYATQSASSAAGTLTLRVAGAGATWDTIGLADSLSRSQSQIACYTVPAGKTLYMYSFDFSVDGIKTVNLFLYQRTGANTTSAPYNSMRVVREYDGVAGNHQIAFKYPLSFAASTDVGFMAETPSSTAAVTVQFDGILVDA